MREQVDTHVAREHASIDALAECWLAAADGIRWLHISVFVRFFHSADGSSVQSDILKNYPDDALLPLIGRIAIAFVVTTCYPMQIHPGRGSFVSLLTKLGPTGCISRLGGDGSTSLFLIATTALIAGSIGVALIVKKVNHSEPSHAATSARRLCNKRPRSAPPPYA